MRGSRRALVGLLSIAAVLVPAAGIAYLGVGSYRSDRGLVAEQLAEHNRAARAVAAAVEARIVDALDAVAVAFREADGPLPDPDALEALRQAHSMARHPFRIAADGRMRYAVRDPLRADRLDDALMDDAFLARGPRTCPERGFDACVRAIRAARRRERLLESARRKEIAVCPPAADRPCRPRPRALADARRAYAALVEFDDTGPAALLGLARLDRIAGDGTAAALRYRELANRFGGRVDPEGLGYDLIAELGAAEAGGDPQALVAVYRGLATRRYRAPPQAVLAIADRVRRDLADVDLAAQTLVELRVLDQRLAEARRYARFAAALAIETENVLRTAIEQPRGRAALHHPDRTLVFRREPDGGVVGVVLEEATLDRAAAAAPIPIPEPAPTTRAIVERVGSRTPAALRTLATAGFGALLPHLTVALVNDRSQPDPLDEIVRARGRRHLILTGGLVGLLLVGLLATIRSAARERELARLKSDFVSTVSHELKTPLTSIRMFAEMLQEGVAGGDSDREARYHSIIVRESERLGLLIANVLDYSQIERGTRRYEVRPEPAVEVAREAVDTFQRLREGERYEVAFAADGEAVEARIAVDRNVVVQSLLNLLSNAAKYGGGDDPIEVRVSRGAPGSIYMSVRDRGPGIPRSEQSRIFREFYRAPQAYSSGVEGTGLGLALVRRHVDELGGRVELDSAPGQGSTFTLVLPEVRE